MFTYAIAQSCVKVEVAVLGFRPVLRFGCSGRLHKIDHDGDCRSTVSFTLGALNTAQPPASPQSFRKCFTLFHLIMLQ